MAKYKPFGEEDLEEALEAGDTSLADWLDSLLAAAGYYDPGPKKPVSFRFMGRTLVAYLPIGFIDIIDNLAQEEGCSKSKWMEAAIFSSIVLRLKAKGSYGMDGSAMTKTLAAMNQLRSAKEMRDLEDLVHTVDEDIRFWLEQMAPNSIAAALKLLFDSVQATKDSELRLAKIRFITTHDEWIQAGMSLLRIRDHPKFHYFQVTWDQWLASTKT